MQMRCYRCSFSFAISRETLAAALASLTVTGNTHHIEYCPRCRTANKIDRQTIARFAPQPTEAELAAARAALESAEAEPEKPEPYRAAEPVGQADSKKKKHRRRRGSGAAEAAADD